MARGGFREGSGRKKLPDGEGKVIISPRLAPAAVNKLRELSDQLGVSMPTVLERLLLDATQAGLARALDAQVGDDARDAMTQAMDPLNVNRVRALAGMAPGRAVDKATLQELVIRRYVEQHGPGALAALEQAIAGQEVEA